MHTAERGRVGSVRVAEEIDDDVLGEAARRQEAPGAGARLDGAPAEGAAGPVDLALPLPRLRDGRLDELLGQAARRQVGRDAQAPGTPRAQRPRPRARQRPVVDVAELPTARDRRGRRRRTIPEAPEPRLELRRRPRRPGEDARRDIERRRRRPSAAPKALPCDPPGDRPGVDATSAAPARAVSCGGTLQLRGARGARTQGGRRNRPGPCGDPGPVPRRAAIRIGRP